MLTNAVSSKQLDPRQLIAVPQAGDVAGAIVYWRLSGDVDYARLGAEWAAAQLDPAIFRGPTSPRAALTAAVKQLEDPYRRAIPLKQGHGYVVARTARPDWDETVTSTVELRVRLHDTDDYNHPEPYLEFSEPNDLDARAVLVSYQRNLGLLSQADFGSWLVRLAEGQHAVALRDTGGIYFIPRSSLDAWHRITAVIDAVSGHRIFEVPAMRSDEAVEAILDAVRVEAEAAIGLITGEIEAGTLGRRALESRGRRCGDLLAKIETYEKLLGTALVDLRGRTEGLQAEAVAAALMAGSEAAGS